MNCPYCGEVLTATSRRFCGSCGRPLTHMPYMPPPQPQAPYQGNMRYSEEALAADARRSSDKLRIIVIVTVGVVLFAFLLRFAALLLVKKMKHSPAYAELKAQVVTEVLYDQLLERLTLSSSEYKETLMEEVKAGKEYDCSENGEGIQSIIYDTFNILRYSYGIDEGGTAYIGYDENAPDGFFVQWHSDSFPEYIGQKPFPPKTGDSSAKVEKFGELKLPAAEKEA